jgi:hypothetical protein
MAWNGSMRVDPDAWPQLTWLFGDDRDRATWKKLDVVTYAEMTMLAPHIMYHPSACWVSVKRVVRNRSSEPCPQGRYCELDGCALDHGGVDDDGLQLDVYANSENYTFYALQLGPAIIATDLWPSIDARLRPLGVKRGQTYVSNECVHISLAYGPLISTTIARAQCTRLNKKLYAYWSLAPDERPDAHELTFNKRFLLKRWDCEYWEALDEYVDIADWEWAEVQEQWKRGRLYLNKRTASCIDLNGRNASVIDPIKDLDLKLMRRTWDNGHPEWMRRCERADRIAAMPPIPNIDKLRHMHAFGAEICYDLDAIIMKLNPESEPADLANYLTSFLAQVEGLGRNRCANWDKDCCSPQSCTTFPAPPTPLELTLNWSQCAVPMFFQTLPAQY